MLPRGRGAGAGHEPPSRRHLVFDDEVHSPGGVGPVPSRKKSESVCQRWQTVCRQTLFPTAKCLPGVSAGRHFGTSSDMGVSAADALQWGKVSAARGSIAGRRFAVGKSVCRQTLLADTPLTLGAPKCLPADGKVSAGRHFQAWQTLSDFFLDGAGAIFCPPKKDIKFPTAECFATP